MALLSLSAKIVSGLIVSVVSSGVIVGTVLATSNNNSKNVEDFKLQPQNPIEKGIGQKREEKLNPSEEVSDKGVKQGVSESVNRELEVEVVLSTEALEKVKIEPEIISSESISGLDSQKTREEDLQSQTLPKEQKVNEDISSPKGTKGKRKVREPQKELSDRERWDQEISKYHVSLESLYKFRVGREDQDQWGRGCILYKGDDIVGEDDDLEITEGRTEQHSYDSCSWQTSWSSNRSEETNKVGFWVEVSLI
ncbi:hypothetical protein MSUIS_00390 [Mycoplasma suis KI3806]|uniref:Uncharacterized protein n=1 Tax=Mycoplasma suis (strain KI_3806) TaxID=708248 RepID=F0V2R0_MYCS3|nr:hypothetical protein [Mycoplasma suis]CBZ40132.1 hypothetical protein MSUIS_00390 [Mycoplasma suis KI3806]